MKYSKNPTIPQSEIDEILASLDVPAEPNLASHVTKKVTRKRRRKTLANRIFHKQFKEVTRTAEPLSNEATTVSVSSQLNNAPPAPNWLSKDAKAVWRIVAPILSTERRTLTEADLGTLESYCTATGTVREMQRILNQDGAIISTDKGPKRHPALGIQNAAMTTARLCASELGLTPVSRSRPAIRDEAPQDDLADLDL